jgi:hypothetical protein
VTPETLELVNICHRQISSSTSAIGRSGYIQIPSRNVITLACQRRHIRMDMFLCRKIFASWLRKEGIQPEIIDML